MCQMTNVPAEPIAQRAIIAHAQDDPNTLAEARGNGHQQSEDNRR
jgi:hypothetical protein